MTQQRRNWPSIFTRHHSKTLTEIAAIEGVSKAAVCQAAKRHGRTYKTGPYNRAKRNWEKIFRDHGHLPAREIAAMTGVTVKYIYSIKGDYL